VYENVWLLQGGDPAHAALTRYQAEVFWRRLLLASVFMVSTYFLTQFAMRPIRKSVELQQRFIATVSHELRTPLTILKNGIEVALHTPEALDREKAVRVLTSALEETDRISDTITFLLALSSLSIQKKIPDMQVVALLDIAQDAVEAAKPQASQQGITLVIEGNDSGQMRGNPTALRGLLNNLIENALRHTPSGGSITVSIESQKKVIRAAVRDTGSGIRKQDLPYIFEPFFQGASKRGRIDHAHLGLGLSLVREVSRLHGGKISVQSKEKEGTTFFLTFPKV
jgi:signal transduction histidine kinase